MKKLQIIIHHSVSRLQQLANLLYTQANLASYHRGDRKCSSTRARRWRPGCMPDNAKDVI